MKHFLKGFLFGILGISLICLAWITILRPQLTARNAALLKEEFSSDVSGANSPGDSSDEEITIDIAALQKKYPDIKAWLTIPGTVVDYPVLQSSKADPEHYLRRNYDGTWRMAGSLFLQYDCKLNSHNLVIYGHNMSDGTMFACLSDMTKVSYLKDHDQITLFTADGIRNFRIVAAKKLDLSMIPFNRTVFAGNMDFTQYAAQMLQGTDIRPQSDMTLITLITCAYDWENARTVVIGVEVSE